MLNINSSSRNLRFILLLLSHILTLLVDFEIHGIDRAYDLLFLPFGKRYTWDLVDTSYYTRTF